MMKNPQYPSDLQDKYLLRLPDGMRDRIKIAAAKNNRSMNSEIVATLEDKYPPENLDIFALTAVLDSVYAAKFDDDFDKDLAKKLLGTFKEALGKAERPYYFDVEPDGRVTFYPTLSQEERDELRKAAEKDPE